MNAIVKVIMRKKIPLLISVFSHVEINITLPNYDKMNSSTCKFELVNLNMWSVFYQRQKCLIMLNTS